MNTRAEQLIESYFANALQEPDVRELRQLLANDPEAAAEFQWQQRLAAGTNNLSLSGSIRNQTFKTAARPPFRQVSIWKKALSAAATVALLAVAYWFINRPPARPANLESVVATNFKYYPNRLPFKSLGGSTDSSVAVPQSVMDAFQLYDDTTRYGEAAQALNIVVAANPDKPEYRFYQGVALIGDHRYSDAVEALGPVTLTDNAYKVPALYYYGLALAGKGDKERARAALQAYLDSEEGIPYRRQVQNVLEAIR